MISPKTVASLGFILKKEKLGPLNVPEAMDLFALEATQPYPGYYSSQYLPEWSGKHPLHMVYFVIQPFEYAHTEKLTRIGQNVLRELELHLQVYPGFVQIDDQNYYGLHLRAKTLEPLGQIIEKFREHGVRFVEKKSFTECQCMINVQKFIKMHFVNEGVYQDMVNSDIYYIQLPDELPWKQFEEITLGMKKNLKLPDFDAALASVHHEGGFMDFVRIYTPDLTSFDMDGLRKKYLEQLKES